MESYSKEIIVYKLTTPQTKPHLGYVRAVAEKRGDSYTPLYDDSFCASGKVFVTGGFEDINSNYDDFELFKVIIIESKQYRPEEAGSDRNCKYITLGTKTADLKPGELIEIIASSLPNPNSMIVRIDFLPSTKYIYLNDSGLCYGPFRWDLEGRDTILLKKVDAPIPGKQLIKGHIYTGFFEDIKRYAIYCPLEEGERYYFTNVSELHNDSQLSQEDYSSDDEIVSNLIKIAKEMGFSSKKLDISSLGDIVKKFPVDEHEIIVKRLSKIHDIYDNSKVLKDDVIDQLGKFLRSEVGEELIEKHIEKNKEEYLSSIEDSYKENIEESCREKSAELLSLREKIERNKLELVNLGKEIESKNKIKMKDGFLDDFQEHDELNKEIESKKKYIEELKDKIAPLLEEYNAYNTLDELKKDFDEINKSYEYEFKRKIILENEIKNLKDLYNKSTNELTSKLFNLKPFVEAINGNVGVSHDREFRDISQEVGENDISNTTAQNILSHIRYSLVQKNRNLSMLDTINVVVTLQQSFICFLAGLPGGGKTTLARLIADIYGIKDKRFLDVPVARGWTGQKDLIGFLNPISNSFQCSSTGMYEFLSALSKESKDKELAPPLSMVLLDEANLSPMEHYWSSFMGLTDPNSDEKEITLGHEKIRIPNNLRFLATINYDSTTENLSPRLIDRSPIIVLEPNSIKVNKNQDVIAPPPVETPISYEMMESCFGNVGDTPNFESENRVYEKIKNILELRDTELGKPITISSRKEIAIRQYCNKARPLMREFSADEELLAFDYATLQLILPLIKGYGKNFKNRLEKLSEILIENELERSLNYLEIIISNGSADLDTYDFFCW